jgi:hypothetical protein
MEMTAAGLAFALLFGAIGAGLFLFGKKQQRLPQLSAGLALMMLPGVLQDTWVMALGGAAVLGVLWFAIRADL